MMNQAKHLLAVLFTFAAFCVNSQELVTPAILRTPAKQIAVSSNLLQVIPATSVTAQVAIDWIDDNWPTNIALTSRYLTEAAFAPYTNAAALNVAFIDTNDILAYALTNWVASNYTYRADNSTLQLSTNQFAVKPGGIGPTQDVSAIRYVGYSTNYNRIIAGTALMTVSNVTATSNFTFGCTFDEAPFVLPVLVGDNDVTTVRSLNSAVGEVTATGFTYSINSSSTGTKQTRISWFAIGRIASP